MPNASGLAAAIRGSTESDTFDLAGQNVNTITNTIQSAFQDPFPIHDMIRITFVTGAGKLGRQKYDANAAQAVTSTLRELGFEDDRGASCVKECAGFFKLQHDTGKNLKTVVVFPRIVVAEEAVADTTGDGGPFASSTASMFQKGSPQEMMALSSKSVFESMVKSRCPSWSQKKGCIVVLTEIKTTVGEMEQKLLTGTPLTDPEQTFYDSVSSNALDEKVEHVKTLMHQQVDDGLLTSKEKTQLVSQVQERLETLSKDLAEAEKENKAKKVEKLKDIMKKAEARKEKLSKITPKGPHRLKHEAEILKLRAEMQPLLDLEEGSKGRLLSVKETQTLARKDEILDEIEELEEKSRGWFEDDEAFAFRISACNKTWSAQSKQQKKKPVKKAATSSSSKSTWVSSTSAKPSWGAKSNSAATKKKAAGSGGGGVFAAMMMDSDSD